MQEGCSPCKTRLTKDIVYMGITRSKLFVNALEEYIIRHNGDMITQKLNEVYDKINPEEFERDLDIGIESLRELTKNDAWRVMVG